MSSAEKVYRMLGNESLWDVAARCNELLNQANIAHSICGGVAVCLHGYQRNTTDVDLIIFEADCDKVRTVLTDQGFRWNGQFAKDS